MKKTLFLLSAAAAFTMASCSTDNKTTETATTDGMTTTTTTTTTSYSDDAIQQRADRIAAAMAAKMKFDDATRTKVRTVYINRGKRLGELQTQYATDTTGMAAAMRTAYMDADMEMKTVFTDPTQYSAYETSRMDYRDDLYMDDAMATGTPEMSTTDASASNSSMSMEEGKTKGADGSKVKVSADGDVKVKDAEGNVMKVDGDDGTMKTKTDNGKTKVE